MNFNWNAKNYRQVINEHLGYRNKRRPRGAVKQLADRLRCHSTFISQVLNERAEFSTEQGIEICKHFQFSLQEQDFFLMLLCRDRAGTSPLRDYYQTKIEQLLEARRDLKPDLQSTSHILDSNEGEYFGNWTYQAVHALTQIHSCQTASAIAKALGLTVTEVNAILERLKGMNLVVIERSKWRSRKDSLHLAKDSPHIRSFRITWKAKLLADLHNEKDMEGTRYSGIITVSNKDYQRVRDVLVHALSQIRLIVAKSPPEGARLLSIDCYNL